MSTGGAALVRAAGGVLWRPAHGAAAGVEVAVVHRPRYDDWSLPKGKLEAGEHPLTAACREVVEETGVRPVVGVRLPSTSYAVRSADGVAPKVVDYWAMCAAEGRFVPNTEVDVLDWLPPEAARARLTQRHDAGVVAAFAALPHVTGTVVLVRHGKAGDRKSWEGDDRLRPLDQVGQAQALRLARVVPWFGPDRVLSVDKVRCVQTVTPLAETLGLTVEVTPVLDEEHHAEEARRVPAALRALAARGGTTVVCSQGGVIPDAVAELARQDRFDLPPPASRKGSVWTLSFAAEGRLVGADYLATLEP